MPDWFLRRTPENHLLLDFYNVNGIYRVIVLEQEKRLRVEEIRNSIWLFLEDIHAATPTTARLPRSFEPGRSGMRPRCGRCSRSVSRECISGSSPARGSRGRGLLWPPARPHVHALVGLFR